MKTVNTYFAAYLTLLISGCSEYAESLGGKYKIFRTNGSEVVIARSNSVIGRVESIDTKPPYVTGYMISIEPPASHADTAIGYFVIDTAKDQCKTGLSKDAWKAELKRINWVKPNLHNPR
jgi:hypothetical protein